jgi:RHS repeat-associated protein
VSETSPANGDRFKYAGGEYDAITGANHFGARYESTADGRFISQDPLGLGPDSDPYRYASNHPIDATDPTGLLPILVPSSPLNALQFQIYAAQAGKAAADIGLAGANSQVSAYQTALASVRARLKELRQRLAQFRDRLQQLESDLPGLAHAVSIGLAPKSALDRLVNQIESTRREIDRVTREIAKLMQDEKKLQDDLSRAQGSAQAYQTAVGQATLLLQQLMDQQRQLQQQQQALKTKLGIQKQ